MLAALQASKTSSSVASGLAYLRLYLRIEMSVLELLNIEESIKIHQSLVEKHSVLRNNSYLFSKACNGNVSNILPVYKDRTGGDVEKAEYQSEFCCFPTATFTDEGSRCAR